MTDFNRLKEEQIKLSKKVILKDSFDKLELISGIDCGYEGNQVVAAIVVCGYASMEVKETSYAATEARIPYVSGYLSYREAPAISEAFRKLSLKPDILLIDGNGILHPRKLGIASHIGVLMDIPTIGIAKSLLLGEIKNNRVYVDKEPRAELLVTRQNARPIYISPGHKVCLKTSVEIVKHCLRFPHKLPEPLHLAHRFAEASKQNVLKD